MSTASHPLASASASPEPDQTAGVSVSAEGDVTVGGDVVGRDSITNHISTTSHTHIIEGGPLVRYAVLGAVGVAALAMIITASIASGNGGALPPTTTPAATTYATLAPASPTPAPPTEHPTHTPSASPTPTVTASPTPRVVVVTVTPSPTQPVTSTASPSLTTPPTEALTRTPTPTPTSSVPVFDDFNDHCLEENLWTLLDARLENVVPLPRRGNCLDPRPHFFAQSDGRLNVFLLQDDTSEAGAEYHFVPRTAGCFEEVEVVLALDAMQAFGEQVNAYLSVGVDVARVSGPGRLEVRVESGNVNGRLLAGIHSRLTVEDGYQNFGALPAYTLGQPVTVAFRVRGNKLTAYVDGQVVAGPFSVVADSCRMSLGYHADPQTLLDGYFDEVRVKVIP